VFQLCEFLDESDVAPLATKLGVNGLIATIMVSASQRDAIYAAHHMLAVLRLLLLLVSCRMAAAESRPRTRGQFAACAWMLPHQPRLESVRVQERRCRNAPGFVNIALLIVLEFSLSLLFSFFVSSLGAMVGS